MNSRASTPCSDPPGAAGVPPAWKLEGVVTPFGLIFDASAAGKRRRPTLPRCQRTDFLQHVGRHVSGAGATFNKKCDCPDRHCGAYVNPTAIELVPLARWRRRQRRLVARRGCGDADRQPRPKIVADTQGQLGSYCRVWCRRAEKAFAAKATLGVKSRGCRARLGCGRGCDQRGCGDDCKANVHGVGTGGGGTYTTGENTVSWPAGVSFSSSAMMPR